MRHRNQAQPILTKLSEPYSHIAPLRCDAHLFGGSHAQRDVVALTLVEAAFAAGDMALARTRAALKPASPQNRRFLQRAGLAH